MNICKHNIIVGQWKKTYIENIESQFNHNSNNTLYFKKIISK